MARKRMISPSMWESLSFSELSDFAKLVFISLISHADDEGRGVAKAGTVTSFTFPNDENKRVADVKKALSEIALKMSVQFYSIDGRDYYVMTNWLDYQTINKPTKSKFPPPPNAGVGGDIRSNGELPHDYGRTTVGLPHDYGNKVEVEDNIKEDILSSSRSNSSLDGVKIISRDDYEYLCGKLGHEDTDYYIERARAFLKKKPEAMISRATILKWHREDNNRDVKVSEDGSIQALNEAFATLNEDL